MTTMRNLKCQAAGVAIDSVIIVRSEEAVAVARHMAMEVGAGILIWAN